MRDQTQLKDINTTSMTVYWGKKKSNQLVLPAEGKLIIYGTLAHINMLMWLFSVMNDLQNGIHGLDKVAH